MRELQTWGSRPPRTRMDPVAFWLAVAFLTLFMILIFK